MHQAIRPSDGDVDADRVTLLIVSHGVPLDVARASTTLGYGNVVLMSSPKCTRMEINVGRSRQAALLGRTKNTVEYLYLSPQLIKRLNKSRAIK